MAANRVFLVSVYQGDALVMLNGQFIMGECLDYHNEIYDAVVVARNLAEVLGVQVEGIEVPEGFITDEDGWGYNDVVEWVNASELAKGVA